MRKEYEMRNENVKWEMGMRNEKWEYEMRNENVKWEMKMWNEKVSFSATIEHLLSLPPELPFGTQNNPSCQIYLDVSSCTANLQRSL